MKRKIVGIFVCVLLIAIMVPISVSADENEPVDNDFNFVFVRGYFRCVDEDEDYFYFAPLGKLNIFEISNGDLTIHNYICIGDNVAKFSKPLMHFGIGIKFIYIIGFCEHWEWIDE